MNLMMLNDFPKFLESKAGKLCMWLVEHMNEKMGYTEANELTKKCIEEMSEIHLSMSVGSKKTAEGSSLQNDSQS